MDGSWLAHHAPNGYPAITRRPQWIGHHCGWYVPHVAIDCIQQQWHSSCHSNRTKRPFLVGQMDWSTNTKSAWSQDLNGGGDGSQVPGDSTGSSGVSQVRQAPSPAPRVTPASTTSSDSSAFEATGTWWVSYDGERHGPWVTNNGEPWGWSWLWFLLMV